MQAGTSNYAEVYHAKYLVHPDHKVEARFGDNHLLCKIEIYRLKVKVKYLQGAFRHLDDQIFHAPWSQALALCR